MRKPNKLVALIFAILASVAMLLPTSAYADSGINDNSGSITINDAEPGHTYNAYQVLVLESYDTDAKAYSYKANTKWGEVAEDPDPVRLLRQPGLCDLG